MCMENDTVKGSNNVRQEISTIIIVSSIFLMGILSVNVSAVEYVNSITCKYCHSAAYSTYQTSTHTRQMCDVTEETMACDADESGSNDFKDGFSLDGTHAFDSQWIPFTETGGAAGDYAPRLSESNGRYTVTIGELTLEITKLAGCSGLWRQHYLARWGSSEYITPLQYNFDSREWVPYLPENWYTWTDSDGDGRLDPDEPVTGVVYRTGDTPVSLGKTDHSWQHQCMGCHVTGLVRMEQNQNGEWLGRPNEQFRDYNIGCESCHGPGSDHVAGGGDPSKIINPSTLNFVRKSEICGQCHSRGTSSAGSFPFPWDESENKGYIPGQVLSGFFRENGNTWPDTTSRQNHQQFIDLKNSPHWSAQVGCWQCHNSHNETGLEKMLQFENDFNTLCNQCHGELTGSVLTNHSHHAFIEMTSASRCSNCHMSKVSTSAADYDISAHTFHPLAPQKTLDYQMPNSCALCHNKNRHGEGAADGNHSDWSESTDRTIAQWADSYWDKWFDNPVPQVKIGANQYLYRPDDDMIVFMEASNQGPTIPVTVYIALEIFGQFYFFPSWNSVPGGFPMTCVTGMDIDPFPLLSFTMVPEIPNGRFNWYLAAIDTDGNLVGDLSVAPWMFESE